MTIYTDGAARGNPGPAGVGVYIPPHGRFKKFIGQTTNNVAEYSAVLFALEKAKQLRAQEVRILMDSQLVAEQLSRHFRIKDKALASLFVKIWNASIGFKKISYQYIPREQNKIADALANQAIDNFLKNQ